MSVSEKTETANLADRVEGAGKPTVTGERSHHWEYAGLEEAVGYRFVDRQILTRAMTHPSFANEQQLDKDNQRLEFLGDAVLGFVVASELYKRPDLENEGLLTTQLSSMVCETTLAAKAREIGLPAYVLLGRGEEAQGGRDRNGLLCDAYEALIAAVYLDGGIGAATDLVKRFFEQELNEPSDSPVQVVDHKGMLQHLVQTELSCQASYQIVETHGPDHEKIFVAEVTVLERVCGRGEGRSKKLAEQCAAADALASLEAWYKK